MKAIKYSIVVCFLFLNAIAFGSIDADVKHAVYHQGENPYLEVSLHIVGKTLTEKKVNNSLVETRTNVLITILSNSDDSIIDFERYSIVSPQSEKPADFIDMKRFTLQPGKYKVRVELTDQLDINNTFTAEKLVTIDPLGDEMKISPLLLLSKVSSSDNTENPFFKYGNIMEPVAFNFYHQALQNLIVFFEIYNSDNQFDEPFAVKFSVIDLNVASKESKFIKYKRLDPDSINIIIQDLSLLNLESGNYKLQIDIVDKQQNIVSSSSKSFQRSNPAFDKELLMRSDVVLENNFINDLSKEDLIYNLQALLPRLPNMDVVTVNILMEEENLKGMKFFLYNYWVNYDPITTEETFNAYNKIAQAVDRKFYSTVGRGFETDRGYIFLKYGKPNNVISVENEPSAPPYEIWFYDYLDLTGENNVRFLFYNPSLGGYDYRLLHSTTRFEKQNRQWEVELYSDAPNDITDNRIDATTVKDSYNRRAREYFEDNN